MSLLREVIDRDLREPDTKISAVQATAFVWRTSKDGVVS